TTPIKITTSSKENEVEKRDFNQGSRKQWLTLREMQQKEYPFPDVEIPRMLEELLALKLIQLLEIKRPEEAKRINDPNFYKYHRLVSHPTERCFVLKEKIVQLAASEKILL
ncbi:hypothetical protein JQN44_27430, partial [Klebsiella pneumoniae]|uniref:hypothetical protein n=1 Tax=Klebsiella pneumoniae TaxID=573 RepID=UPI001939887B